jgi:prephenate dehydrogenase
MVLFKQVTIVGLGLMGGSLGMAIRRHHLAREVVGLSRSSLTVRRARQRGAIDRGTTDAAEAVNDADVVVLATPVHTIIPSAQRLARHMRAGAVLTDVGSTKAQIVRTLERTLPPHVAFVGTHPLAGSEQRGLAAARSELLDGSVCIVTATKRTRRLALARVRRLWSALGCQVVVLDPQTHDRCLAQVSHLPHLVAFCLVEATNHDALAVAPRSFLEATRVAKSDPNLWDGILLSNRTALLGAMDRLDRQWRRLRHHLVHRDRAALRRFLRHAQTTRYALQG